MLDSISYVLKRSISTGMERQQGLSGKKFYYKEILKV